MRGFHQNWKRLTHQAVGAALSALAVSVSLVNGGCAGVVNGHASKSGGGTPAPLTISGVTASNITFSSVVISWQSSAPANSQVQYGTSTNYGSATNLDPTMASSHQQTVPSLKPGTLYHFRVSSTDANSNTGMSGDMTFTTTAATPPAVSITSPAANATLSGTVNLTASATDNAGVAGVQYQVDGAKTGPMLATTPYNYSLNTTALSNGNHILTAVASDNSGNSAVSAGVPVIVKNSSTTPDTTPPVVTITAPANNSTVSLTITLAATATDPDSAVSFVQFLVDGVNTGTHLTSTPYSTSLNTATLSNGTHTLTATAKDPAGNQGTSAAITITVSNSAGTGATGPLRPLASNAHYFTDGSGKAILLTGSQTWDTFQDLDTSASPAAFDFTGYVNFLKSHGHNVTILWRKDLPTYCGWGAGGIWHIKQFPWKRTGGSSGNQVASDGLPAFDLTQLDQTYFDRLRARVIQLQQNGIYAIVELFDGLGITVNRCSTDGYPFTGGNNVNGVDDGGGTNSMTMGSPDAITNIQDAYVQKVIDTVNDQPNVLWEISEEAPDNSTWWQGHMISLIHTYEGGKPFQHPVGFPTLNVSGASDATLYNSNADWVAPKAKISPTSSCGSGTPACKVNINDSDHSYFGMWNDSAQTNRNYVWENFTNGDSVMFMDPYLIYWTSGNRNLCQSPSNGVCSGPDSRWNNMRDNLGYTLNYANKMDLTKMTPQGNLSSTGHCLADTVATGAEYLVYAPNGGNFTVNLSATARVLNVEWLNPATGAMTPGVAITGGTTKSFTAPFSGDAVLYIVDAAGHN